MVEVFLDDRPVDTMDFADQTLEQALRRLQDEVCAERRVIVGVRCDGLELAGGDMPTRLQAPVAGVGRLEVYTGTRAELVGDAMRQAAAALTDADDERRRVAELLTEGQIAEGVSLLGELLKVYQQVHDAVGKSLQMLEVDAQSIEIGGRSLHACFDEPKQLLLRIKQALLAQDHTLLADIMQYEFDEVVQEWQRAVAEVHRRAETAG